MSDEDVERQYLQMLDYVSDMVMDRVREKIAREIAEGGNFDDLSKLPHHGNEYYKPMYEHLDRVLLGARSFDLSKFNKTMDSIREKENE